MISQCNVLSSIHLFKYAGNLLNSSSWPTNGPSYLQLCYSRHVQDVKFGMIHSDEWPENRTGAICLKCYAVPPLLSVTFNPRMDEWLRWVKFVNYHKTQKQNKVAFWRRYHKVGWMWLPQTVGKEEEPKNTLGKLEIESFPGMKQKRTTGLR